MTFGEDLSMGSEAALEGHLDELDYLHKKKLKHADKLKQLSLLELMVYTAIESNSRSKVTLWVNHGKKRAYWYQHPHTYFIELGDLTEADLHKPLDELAEEAPS